MSKLNDFIRLVILGNYGNYPSFAKRSHLGVDYLMLNTDRGADNYMIKYCTGDHGKTLVDVAPSRTSRLEPPMMTELRRSPSGNGVPHMDSGSTSYSRAATPSPQLPYTRQPHIHIAAIDNSLSFPHEHPKGWRSYTYGWLYLPVTIIGRPFSQKTRDHFLPFLTSKVWWAETTYQLRKLFAVDPDFHPKMFRVGPYSVILFSTRPC